MAKPGHSPTRLRQPWDADPEISPDGRSLAFIRIKGGVYELWRLSLAEGFYPQGEPKPVNAGGLSVVASAWMPGRPQLLLSAGTGASVTEFYRVPASGSAMPRLVPGIGAGWVTRPCLCRVTGLSIRLARSAGGPDRPGLPAAAAGVPRLVRASGRNPQAGRPLPAPAKHDPHYGCSYRNVSPLDPKPRCLGNAAPMLTPPPSGRELSPAHSAAPVPARPTP